MVYYVVFTVVYHYIVRSSSIPKIAVQYAKIFPLQSLHMQFVISEGNNAVWHEHCGNFSGLSLTVLNEEANLKTTNKLQIPGANSMSQISGEVTSQSMPSIRVVPPWRCLTHSHVPCSQPPRRRPWGRCFGWKCLLKIWECEWLIQSTNFIWHQSNCKTH